MSIISVQFLSQFYFKKLKTKKDSSICRLFSLEINMDAEINSLKDDDLFDYFKGEEEVGLEYWEVSQTNQLTEIKTTSTIN